MDYLDIAFIGFQTNIYAIVFHFLLNIVLFYRQSQDVDVDLCELYTRIKTQLPFSLRLKGFVAFLFPFSYLLYLWLSIRQYHLCGYSLERVFINDITNWDSYIQDLKKEERE